MLRPDFDSSPFYRSHMRDPRGRGSWAFSFEPSPNDITKPLHQRGGALFTPALSFSEAKRYATAQARQMQAEGKLPADLGNVTLFVLP